MSKKEKSATEPEPAGQTPEDLEIDLGAALPPQPPKPKRGRPRSATPPKPHNPNRKVRKDKGVKKTPKAPQPPYIDNNILVGDKIIRGDDIDYSDNKEFQSATKLKDQMTEKELSFLSSYLSGGVTIDKAMIQAGYGDYNGKYRYQLSRKIIEKYESQAQDHRIIARALGAGEVFIINTLYLLAKDSKSEKIRGENAMNLAKILGMTKEQIEGAGGVTIIFEGPGATASLPGAPPPPPPSTPPQAQLPGPTPTKPMMITK